MSETELSNNKGYPLGFENSGFKAGFLMERSDKKLCFIDTRIAEKGWYSLSFERPLQFWNISRIGGAFFIGPKYMERLSSKHNPEIVWPQSEIVEVTPDVDFVYIMRKDNLYAVAPLAKQISSDYKMDEAKVKTILLGEYEAFLKELFQALIEEFSKKGKFQLHLFENTHLKEKVLKNAGNLPVVSLDPLISDNVLNFKVSRGYYMGGINSFGQVARPGSLSLQEQAQNIASKVSENPVCIIEDDIFEGGSLMKAVNNLTAVGVKIVKSVAGFQIGDPTEVIKAGITIEPAVKYKTTDGSNIFAKVDLGDPRDFLIGSDGLVIKLPNGKFARAPYILPFVSTTARASVPDEASFGGKALWANLGFYTRVEQKIEKPILLKHLNPYFMTWMKEIHETEEDYLIVDLINICFKHYYKLWDYYKQVGEWHKNKEENE